MKPFLYDRLYASLLLELAGGHYSPNERFLSLRQISERFGASKPTANTVQRRLLDEKLIYTRPRSGTFVAAGARERAMLTISEKPLLEGPLPHTWQSKREQLRLDAGNLRPRHIMVLYHLSHTPRLERATSSLRASKGCLDSARERNTKATLVIHDGSEKRHREILEWIKVEKIGGALIVQRAATFRQFHEIVDPLLQMGLPVVNLFGDTQGANLVNVDFNNVAGGFQAAMRMIEAGHQRLTVVYPAESLGTAALLRLEGVRLAAQQQAVVEELTVEFQPDETLSPNPFTLTPPPEALICLSHDFAVAALAHAKGISRPGIDFSLIAFSSIAHTPEGTPFDIIKLNFDFLGAQAMNLLLDLMEGKETHRTRLIPVEEEHHGTIRRPPSHQRRHKSMAPITQSLQAQRAGEHR